MKAKYSSSYKENLNGTLSENEGRIRKDTPKDITICPLIRVEENDQ